MPSCPFHAELHKKRRAALLDAMVAQTGLIPRLTPQAGPQGADEPGAVAVFPAAPVFPRNNDVDHDYRQDSDLYYLTGFDEPQSVLVLTAHDRKATLFVRPRDPEREVWDGPRAGVDGAKAQYGADESFAITELTEQLPKLFQNQRRIYYRLGRDRPFDDKVLEAIDRTRSRARMGVTWPTEITDPGSVLHEMRLIKVREDLDAMRTAAEITKEAHLRAMHEVKPGMHEFEVEALLLETFRRNGSERPAYGSIVGSGANATVLHYRQNKKRMEPGELLLIDAGCEFGYYASDVTRTFPVSGKFNKEQQAIYELVLDAQEQGIALSRKGTTIEQIHKKSVDVITRGLVRLGLLTGEPEKLIAEEAYKPFFMHRTSHWLGMDVHDVGAYYRDGRARELEPGMVLTVEPGIYISKDNDRVAPEWRGIGVRIEDDILVTDGEPQNLTGSIPKTVQEIERACA
jgi:Xaa-Pro aminopeptidase